MGNKPFTLNISLILGNQFFSSLIRNNIRDSLLRLETSVSDRTTGKLIDLKMLLFPISKILEGDSSIWETLFYLWFLEPFHEFKHASRTFTIWLTFGFEVCEDKVEQLSGDCTSFDWLNVCVSFVIRTGPRLGCIDLNLNFSP